MKLLRFLLVSLLSISNAFLPTKHDLALKVVKSTSGMLANADTVGHRILNGNKVIIDFLLDHKEIAMEYKKPFILLLIESAQVGDSMGSHILETYYDLVNNAL